MSSRRFKEIGRRAGRGTRTPPRAPAIGTRGSIVSGDDDVALATFSLSATSTVILQSYSYGGGTNEAGQAIAAGGFDPMIALYDSSGIKFAENDDDGGVHGNHDPATQQVWDVFLEVTLLAGDYTVALTQYNNMAPLTLGGAYPGAGTTGFVDDTGDIRTSAYAFDIIVEAPARVPEPPGLALMGLALAGIAAARRRKQ